MKTKKSLALIFWLNSLFAILLAAILIGTFALFEHKISNYNEETEKLRQETTNTNRIRIKADVNQIFQFIDSRKNQIVLDFQMTLKEFVSSAWNTSENIYKENKDKHSDEEIKKMIRDALREFRAKDGKYYISIEDISFVSWLYPPDHTQEGKISQPPVQGTHSLEKMKSQMEEIAESGEGFIEYIWSRPSGANDKQIHKISYIRYFTPYKWFISAGDYLDDIDRKLKNDIIERISNLTRLDHEIFFIIDSEGLILWHPEKRYIGRNIAELSENIKKVFLNLNNNKEAKSTGVYLEYRFFVTNKPDEINKICFVKGYPELGWFIGAGFGMPDLNQFISYRKSELKNELIEESLKIITAIIFLILISFLFYRKIFRTLSQNTSIFIDFFRNSPYDRSSINVDKISYSEFDILAKEANKMLDSVTSINEKLKVFRDIFKNTPDAVHILDANGVIIEQNMSAQELYGYTMKQLKDKRLGFIVGEKLFDELMKDIFLHGTLTTEIELSCNDGKCKNILFSGFTIRDSYANPVNYVTIHREITERVKADDKIKELHKQIEFILGATGTGLDIIDSDYNLVYVDPEWQRIYGPFEGKKCYDYFMANDIPCNKCILHSAFESGKIVVSEMELPKENNKIVQVTTIPFQNAAGKWLAAEINVNITERKKTENELKDHIAFQNVVVDIRTAAYESSEAELWLIFLESMLHNYGFSMAWYGHYENSKVKPLFWAGVNDPYLDKLELDVTPANDSGTTCILSKAILNKHPFIFQDLEKDKDCIKWRDYAKVQGYRSSLALPFIIKGKVEGGILIYSARVGDFPKERSMRILALVEDFAAFIKEKRKTFSIECSLKNSIIELQESCNSKSEMLENMNYALRTPLNGIMSATELFENTGLSPEQKEYMEILHLSSSGLKNILNDLLDSNDIEKNKLVKIFETFDIISHVESIIKTVQFACKRKKLNLKFTTDDEIPHFVSGDKLKFTKILESLLDNSIKFTDSGLIHIAVECLEKNDENCLLRFKIQDTGVGIPEEKQNIISDLFEKKYDKKFKYGSLGMGLAIAKKYIDFLGGRIGLESNSGAGSLFYFEIAFDWPEEKNQESPDIQLQSSQLSLVSLKKMNILIAEDDFLSQKITKKVIEKYGHSVTVAENGKQVLALLENQKFDMMFMDLQMPEMDGYELINTIRIREKTTNTHLPVIAVTAFDSEEERSKCLAFGIDDFVAKPFTNKILLEKVSKFAPAK